MYEGQMGHEMRHGYTGSDQGQHLLFLDVKLETLAPTLLNQPSFPFQLRDPFVRVFFRHAAFLHRSILDRTLDAKRHLVGRPGKGSAINT